MKTKLENIHGNIFSKEMMAADSTLAALSHDSAADRDMNG